MHEELIRKDFDGAFCQKFELLVDRFSFFHFFPKRRKSVEQMIHQKKSRGNRTSKIVKSRQSSGDGHLPCHLFNVRVSARAHGWRGMWIRVRSKDAQKQLAQTSLNSNFPKSIPCGFFIWKLPPGFQMSNGKWWSDGVTERFAPHLQLGKYYFPS